MSAAGRSLVAFLAHGGVPGATPRAVSRAAPKPPQAARSFCLGISRYFGSISSMKRLFSLAQVAPLVAADGVAQRAALFGTGDGHVEQAAFLFQVGAGVCTSIRLGKRSSSRPTTCTCLNSSPLAEWMVIRLTRSVSFGSSLSASVRRATSIRKSLRVLAHPVSGSRR
jgi:hypothetical protein